MQQREKIRGSKELISTNVGGSSIPSGRVTREANLDEKAAIMIDKQPSSNRDKQKFA